MTERSSERLPRHLREPQPDGVVTVAKALAPQLGSDNRFLVEQASDHRVTAVTNELTQAALGHFDYRGDVDKVRYYRRMVDWELCSTPSLGGLGRRQIIQAIAAAAGVGKGALDVAEKPGFWGRHFTERDWKEKAVKEGKVVTE